jgi:nitroimidazol reductase NimA-like FMN-containing flavoprotein (pyridoxamine 5'-phosphate oxidase superfamily)
MSATPSDVVVPARSRVKRLPDRAAYDRATIDAILDEGYVAHVGIATPDERGGVQPFVLPLAYVRRGDALIVHGSIASRALRRLAEGASCCVTVTHLDGLVLARSAFHHSMNYRAAMVFGTGRPIEGAAEKTAALDALMDRIAPGRQREARPPSPAELKQTLVVEIAIEEASAKTRTGDPKDDAEDLALPVWAGVVPLRHTYGAPVPSADLASGIAVPAPFRDAVGTATTRTR